ncbi:MAG: response regulator transcription factor [Cyclobacteriaceae bacterium]|nr:response regulator transcription factor [Cyclobacteriaceae bacterium HetDA_MAG_MS6]
MKKVKCIAYSRDRFALELIADFIEKTPTVELEAAIDENTDLFNLLQSHSPDLIIIDVSSLEEGHFILEKLNPTTKTIVISADSRYVHAVLKEDLLDFIEKSSVSYPRLVAGIGKFFKVKAA